ncbi:MAG: thiopurine S-methyltransferase [Pseudomonadales bacterium]|jgi:thiopurine S-methyltransferase|nr:thiopurine S-methyltransferase [Pseudomonadales bacterium]
MEAEFWLVRWQRGETGFNQPSPHGALERHWHSLDLKPGATVFVPLSGKSVDMCWLAERGYKVVAIELSAIAVREFFEERHMQPETQPFDTLTRYRAGPYCLWQGDIFDLTDEMLGAVDAIFDRAALIALPAAMRERYVRHLARLTHPGVPTLLVTLEYDQTRMSGPPHSVLVNEVHRLYGADHTIEELECTDQLADMPRFRERGLDALTERVYQLVRIERR